MPISPNELFNQVGLKVCGTVPWGTKPQTTSPGVYSISMSADPEAKGGVFEEAPVDLGIVRGWISRVPSFTFKGETGPSAEEVVGILKTFWLSDECIVYVGKATSLKSRLGQYFGHTLGNRSPHAGGHWIKTLSCCDSLFVHYAEVESAVSAPIKESEALQVFKSQVSGKHLGVMLNPIPFANREHPQGNRKQNAIGKDVLRR
jgi:hypothetical protein